MREGDGQCKGGAVIGFRMLRAKARHEGQTCRQFSLEDVLYNP